MAYQRFDGSMSFLPSRFEAQAILSEMQKKRDEDMRLLRLKQAEEKKQQTEALRSELNIMLSELRAMTANREATMSKFLSQTSTPPRPPFPPPDPPDYKTDLTPKTSTNKKTPLRYSCEEIYERMEKGYCIFCEDLDTPGHYDLKHKRSKFCLVECVDDRLPDEELVEPAVEEISNKSANMIQDGESNPENESRPEVSVSQSQVSLSSMEPSRRCHKESLDFVDKSMCNELTWDEDGDSIITMSAKFGETYEDPRLELVSLEQSHDPVENHLDNIESALTTSSLRHSPTYQCRAPFNPCQNHSDKPHNKSKFGNCIGHEIEFDREGDEIEDDELQDKQIEQTVETLITNEGEQPLYTTRHNNLFNEMVASLGLVGGDDQEDGTKLARKKIVKKNNSETKMKSSLSYHSCFVALITTSNLHKDTLSLPKDFTTSNGVKRECREIVLTDKSDRAWALELRFKQVGNGKILVMFPAEKASKKSFPVEVMHWINQKNEAGYSPNEKISYTSTSGLCQAKRDHEVIRVLEKLIQSEFSLDLSDCSSLTGLFCKPKLGAEVTVLLEGNMNIKRTTFFGRNVVKWKCWLVMGSRLPLHYWVARRKRIVWEVLCILQNNTHRLLLMLHELQKGKLCFWSSNGRIGTASGELQEWDDVVAGHFLFDMVEKSNYLDEVIEEVASHMYNFIEKVAKRFILAMIDEHKDIKTACVFLEMSLNRERLIQLGAPPVFSDFLCVMNRIRVRLKLVLLLGFLWLILFTSKMVKSSNVHQNKNQIDQKLSSYWKLLLRLLHPLHINRWSSFYLLVIKSLFKGKEETVSSNIAVTSWSRFGFFPYSTWMVNQNRHASSSCALRQDENYVMVMFTIAEALTFFNDQHTLVAEKNGTETSIVLKQNFGRAAHQLQLKQSLFFLTVLKQWKWYPPTQAIRSFAKLSMTSNQILYP